jgi:CelD/BcsL family acetyltransferase involved in cellulose biosynthesis
MLIFGAVNRRNYKRAARKLLGRDVPAHVTYHLSAEGVLRAAIAQGFEIRAVSGYNWAPFDRLSNTRLVGPFAWLERRLKLGRFAEVSPVDPGRRQQEAGAVSVVSLDPRTDARWAELVERRGGSLFNAPAWIRAVAETYDFEPEAQVLLDERGAPTAGLAFCRIRDPLGERIVSFPFSDYCDPLVGERDEWNALVQPLLEAGCPIALRCLHNAVPLADERFPQVRDARWHRMDLRPDLETLWSGLDESARRAIRKAQKNGVTVRFGQDEATLRAFFELHRGVRKYKYRLLAQPYAFFQGIWRHFIAAGRGAVAVALHEDRIVGGILLVEHADTLYYKFNASSPEALDLRVNDITLWESIRYAKESGKDFLDFGLSDSDQEGLLRYKRKYASVEKTISFLRHSPPGLDPANGQLRGVLGQLTALLTEESVPDEITERAGDILYRFFV